MKTVLDVLGSTYRLGTTSLISSHCAGLNSPHVRMTATGRFGLFGIRRARRGTSPRPRPAEKGCAPGTRRDANADFQDRAYRPFEEAGLAAVSGHAGAPGTCHAAPSAGAARYARGESPHRSQAAPKHGRRSRWSARDVARAPGRHGPPATDPDHGWSGAAARSRAHLGLSARRR
jgi:hypothetical protein